MSVLIAIHVFLCVVVVAVILLQDPKGGSVGGIFGGGGSGGSLFSPTGGTNFLQKMTRNMGIGLALTCIALALMAQPQRSSVVDDLPTTEPPASDLLPDLGQGSESNLPFEDEPIEN